VAAVSAAVIVAAAVGALVLAVVAAVVVVDQRGDPDRTAAKQAAQDQGSAGNQQRPSPAVPSALDRDRDRGGRRRSGLSRDGLDRGGSIGVARRRVAHRGFLVRGSAPVFPAMTTIGGADKKR
jgi:hypothetical protein